MDVIQRARKFALAAYGSERELEHPDEVARLVAGAGGDDELQAAALLHDVVEDSDVDVPQIEAEFGPPVAGIVAAMTEDDSIEAYEQRKGEHRQRAVAAGRETALVFVADKVSNIRRMQRGQKKPDPRKVAHYAATLDLVRATYPELALLDELEAELVAPGTRARDSARSISSA